MTRWVGVSVLFVQLALLLPACGTSHSTECTFNSDCAAGRYCTARGSCTADCTTDSECVVSIREGATCSSFGQCIAPPDAGPGTDSGVDMDAGHDAGLHDAGSPLDAPIDAPPPDARVCATTEVCTPSIPGAVVEDENCNGQFDEGCGWFFGRPQWLANTSATVDFSMPVSTGAPRLSQDGLRLYLTACNQGLARCLPYVSERASVDAPFAAALPLAGAWDGFRVWGITPSPDELEVIFEGDDMSGTDTGLWRATRATRAASFGAPALITELSQTGPFERVPGLSRDGLEIFFSRDYVMMRATRPSLGAAFGAPVTVGGITLPAASTPSLSVDGLTMFFHASPAAASPQQLYRATRTTTTSTTFSAPVALDALVPGTSVQVTPFYSEQTRELFYIAGGGWSPANNSGNGSGMWRVQVCRDHACAEPTIDCPVGGVRSPDGYHCYVPGASMQPWDVADGTCASGGRHLATIHSRAEQSLVWTLLPSGGAALWVGGYDGNGPSATPMPGRPTMPQCERTASGVPCAYAWTTGEPWTYASWGASDPNGGASEDCLSLWGGYSSDFGNVPCSMVAPYVCESEIWPTW